MPLPTPNLDDRRFQDIVDEAKRLIPRYCPEWTDHNVSDPGVTLIELFAWMMEMLLYRLNKVPDKNFVTFLDLIGVKLQPPNAARADITFTLSAPQPEMVTIPAGTEVATVRTETQEAITFSTDEALHILPPHLIYVLITPDHQTFTDQSDTLGIPTPLFPVFEEKPRPGNAFYLGFQENLAGNTLVLTFDCTTEGIGVDPNDPPLVWESWDAASNRWVRIEVESDSTGGLNRHGEVVLHLPSTFSMNDIDLKRGWWVRCQVIEPRPDQPMYTATPQLRIVGWHTIGGTVTATNAVTVTNEELGRSSGEPGQVFRVEHTPLLMRRADEIVEVECDEGWEQWTEVKDFSGSGPQDRHYTVDSGSGEVRFGPAIRQPNGEEHQYGMVPPKGRRIRFRKYRYGGGTAGNVGRRTITVLKSSIPYVSAVVNREAAFGGTDAESLEHAKMRGPLQLRTRGRAVTAEDYEILAKEASPGVARAKCIQPSPTNEKGGPKPGTVWLLIVPVVTQSVERIVPRQLEISKRLEERVQSYLDERRLLTTALIIDQPRYQWVSVQVQIKVQSHLDPIPVKDAVERELYHFLNPLIGGTEGTGWPFGRDLYIADVYALVQSVPGVEFISDAKLFPVDVEAGKVGQPTQHIPVPRGGLICSYRHLVITAEGR